MVQQAAMMIAMSRLLLFQSATAGEESYCVMSARLKILKGHVAYCIQSAAGTFTSHNLLQQLMLADNVHIIGATYEKSQEGLVFVPGSTYAEGRNALLYEACRLEVVRLRFRFSYLVFVDDDIEILGGSFSAWHSDLLFWEPAVMVPSYRSLLDQRRYKGRPVGVWQYDSFFVAYHRELADALLPLNTSLDDAKVCWWSSSFYIQYLSGIHLQGHCLLSDKLVVQGMKEGTYPRQGCRRNWVWKLIKATHADIMPSLDDLDKIAGPTWYLEWGVARKRGEKSYDLSRQNATNWSLHSWRAPPIKGRRCNLWNNRMVCWTHGVPLPLFPNFTTPTTMDK